MLEAAWWYSSTAAAKAKGAKAGRQLLLLVNTAFSSKPQPPIHALCADGGKVKTVFRYYTFKIAFFAIFLLAVSFFLFGLGSSTKGNLKV